MMWIWIVSATAWALFTVSLVCLLHHMDDSSNPASSPGDEQPPGLR